MSMVDRINRAILRRVADRSVASEMTPLSDRIEQIARLSAIMGGGFGGDTAMLVAELDDGTSAIVVEDGPDWAETLAALDASGRAIMSSTELRLRLLAQPEPIWLIGGDQNGPAA